LGGFAHSRTLEIKHWPLDRDFGVGRSVAMLSLHVHE
jgi:hypothetical protein